MRFKEGQAVDGIAVIEPGKNEVSTVLLYADTPEQRGVAATIAGRLDPVCELVPVTITVARRAP